MMKLHAEIGFHVPMTNDGKSRAYVEITDRISGCVILEAELTFDDYATGILRNMHSVPCVVELSDSENIGKKAEHKHEVVWVPEFNYKLGPDGNQEIPKVVTTAVAEFEVDGWKARRSDCCNHHNWVRKDPPRKNMKGHWMNVTFFRWVEATDEEREAAKRNY